MSAPNSQTIALLNEVAEYLEGYEDVRDGPDGPLPNAAMSLRQQVDLEIERLSRPAGPSEADAIRDALDHIMRVSRQGISPTKRLDWIEIRARYALEGKPWSQDIRETPRDSVKKMEKDFAACRAELAALKGKSSATSDGA